MRAMTKVVVGLGIVASALGISVVGARAEVAEIARTCTGPGQNVRAFIMEISLNGPGAKRDASKRGGYLAVIKSAEMNACVGALIADFGGGNFWLGGADGKGRSEGNWTWVDGASFWSGAADGSTVDGSFESWSAGEPNNSGGREDCLEWSASGWNDINCRELRYYVMMIDN